jgi:hypothetical protein
VWERFDGASERISVGYRTGAPPGVYNYLILLTSVSGYKLYCPASSIDFVAQFIGVCRGVNTQ